ncbi:MAG: YabP/YqfC family sporulation protein [Bacillota bacterium]|jgi:sporulation protein YqfC|nr:sporulation protein YqfC [Bacillota bacterium]
MGKEAVAKKIADIFDLPRDLIANTFRLTLVGRGQLFIENHKGIILYDPELIRLNVRGGEIKIAGSQLQVRSVYAHEVYIEGAIENISLEVRP